MKIQFSIWHALLFITITSIGVFAWVSNSNHRIEISALETKNESLTQSLAETSERLRLTERALLVQMKDVLADPPAPFSCHGIAKDVVQRIAIEYPNDQYIWWVLTRTEALYNGISITDANALLGPPADKSDPKHMFWYDDTADKPLKLRAVVNGDRLENWASAHGFRD